MIREIHVSLQKSAESLVADVRDLIKNSRTEEDLRIAFLEKEVDYSVLKLFNLPEAMRGAIAIQ